MGPPVPIQGAWRSASCVNQQSQDSSPASRSFCNSSQHISALGRQNDQALLITRRAALALLWDQALEQLFIDERRTATGKRKEKNGTG